MVIDLKRNVGEIAAEVPGAVRLFESMGIDYCCGGAQSLDQACRQAGVPVGPLVESLGKGGLPSTGDGTSLADWKDRTVAELIQHILDRHHAYTRTQGDRLRDLAKKVEAAHGMDHPELKILGAALGDMLDELDGHMTKEEEVVFPAVLEAVNSRKPGQGPWTNPRGLVHPLKILRWEHAMTGDEFQQLHPLTQGFTVPPDGCAAYGELYRGLVELEADLHRHVHLENNILFPKAEATGLLD